MEHSFTIYDHDDMTILMFDEPVAEGDLDSVNNMLMKEFPGLTCADIDWRDDLECWLTGEGEN